MRQYQRTNARKRSSYTCFAISVLLSQLLAMTTLADSLRVEIPIKQTVLPDGQLRYSIALTVGGTPVEAMFDSGSVGLRLLPGAVPDSAVAKERKRSVYGYASGVQLSGPFAKAVVAIGEATTLKPVYVQVVDQLACLARRPDCPSAGVKQEDYRIGGAAFAGQGFRAIIGTGLRPAGVVNPLAYMGDGIWIITLPRPGDSTSGTLIINPSADERQGYTLYALQRQTASTPIGRVTGWEDSMPGCLVDIDAKRSVCGATLLDTGAPGFRIFSANAADLTPWSAGTHAAIVFNGSGAESLSTTFNVLRQPGARVSAQKPSGDQPAGIRAGTLPYYEFSVLYDSKAGKIGLKRRDVN